MSSGAGSNYVLEVKVDLPGRENSLDKACALLHCGPFTISCGMSRLGLQTNRAGLYEFFMRFIRGRDEISLD